MDSLTQFLLGASISGAILGPRLGGHALLIGGLVGTLPDLDSFIPMGNAIDDMTHHRGPSHSVLVQTALAPVIALAVRRLVPDTRQCGWLLLLTIWLCLTTHAVLDSLTTYGTQIFWPLGIGPPVAFSSVFIIDPIYSLLLLAGVLTVLVWRKNRARAVRANRALLMLSTFYLCLGATGHLLVKARAESDPAFEGRRVFVQPTPFNIVFWQAIGLGDDDFVTGLTSPWSACGFTDLAVHPRLSQPPAGFDPSSSVRRLEWFTDGFYSYQNSGQRLRIADLRIGYAPDFVFVFDYARKNGTGFETIDPAYVEADRPRPEQVKDLLANAIAGLNDCSA